MSMPIMPANVKLTNLANYLINTYISVKFTNTIWADLTSSTSRTTNNFKTFHSVFKKYWKKCHPNTISIFLKYLIRTEFLKVYVSFLYIIW